MAWLIWCKKRYCCPILTLIIFYVFCVQFCTLLVELKTLLWDRSGFDPHLTVLNKSMEFTMRLRKTSSKSRATHNSTNSVKLVKKRRKPGNSKARRCVCSNLQECCFDFPQIWEELRVNKQLCDGVVRCEDGVEIKIHRALLSAVSPYFKALFTNSINRDQPEATEANMNVSSDIFNMLLDFAYTGNCIVNEKNVENLLKYADQYEILGVVQLCCQFLMDELCPANCLGILEFANQYFCKELTEKGKLYVRHHFVDVMKESNEFLNINFKDLEDILLDDQLNVKTEEIVFDAIKMWINYIPDKRQIHLPDLMKCIRFGNLSCECIERIWRWSLIENNEICKKYLEDTVKTINDIYSDDLDINNYLFRPRIPYDVLFAVGGWSAGSPTNFVETYDTNADRWLLSVDTDTVPRAYHGLCTLRGLIYMIGGFDGNEYFNTVRCFDPLSHCWSECACMYYPRCYVSVVVYHDKIYALGGYNGRIRMSSAERYDPDKNQWEIIASMQRQRSDASAATLQDKIYIVGGFNGQEVMSSAEVFDPSSNQWTYISPMTSARSGVSLVAFRNTLYALGGFNGYTRLTSAEKFVPDCGNCWSDICEMMTPRSNFATVILDDFIYVIGGFNDRFVSGSTTVNYVEYYDTETNQWFEAASMNLNRSALSACVLSGLPNAKDYSVIGRNQKQLGQGAGKHET